MTNGYATVTVDGVAHVCGIGQTLGTLAAVADGVPAPCGGHGRCGKCRVTVQGAVSQPDATERRVLSAADIAAGIRLACRCVVQGDCVVATPGRAGGGQIRTDGAAVYAALRPAFNGYGAAIDIGTTTLAARLYAADGRCVAEAACLNPQSRFGADVISRMEAAMAGHADALAAAVRAALDELLLTMATQAGVVPTDIDGAVVTGNTAMLHLLTLTDPEPLTHAPFAAKQLFGHTLSAAALGLQNMAADGAVYLPRCIAAFVGADITCAVLASGLCDGQGPALLADIGTNGEMALWQNDLLQVCSTAAGPAFEGAGISMGMGGQTGAIDRMWTAPDTGALQAHVIGDVPPVGICGSGLVDAVACLLKAEALDETGYLEEDPVVLAGPVALTQQDLRMVQLAKGAIHAGLRTLLHTQNIAVDAVKTLYIAGGFGSYLDVQNAGCIGLLPVQLCPKVQVLGNAALAGAAMLLLDAPLRHKADALAGGASVVELAANPVFAQEYMERMLF